MKTRHVVSILRRDAEYVWHAMISVVFIGFATLAVAAALVDVVTITR